MSKSTRFLVVAALVALIASGCATTPKPTVSPLKAVSPLKLSSPLPTSSLPQGPRFTISLPVKAGDTVVRGTGGPGVPLRVVNITQMASELGQGKVGPDGKFEIKVPPLKQADEIGLMLGDLAGTRFKMTDFMRGPGYVDIPYIGIVFTTAQVTP